MANKPNSLEVLEQLTPLLSGLRKEAEPIGKKVVVYNSAGGTTIGVGLFKNDRVAVQRTFMTRDTTFPTHIHPGHEWGLVYEGEIVGIVDGVETVYRPGDMITWRSGAPHSARTTQDTWVLFITFPPDREGYPDGP